MKTNQQMRKSDVKESLRRRWNALMVRLNVADTKSAAFTFNLIYRMYNSNGRYYHTPYHLYNCLNLLDSNFMDTVTDLNSLEYAIFFHDIIYCTDIPQRNETASAALACDISCGLLGLTTDFSRKVDLLIRATQHLPDYRASNDEKIIIDIDLYGLSKDYEEFESDSLLIKKEYYKLREVALYHSRCGFLESMLRRNYIYKTKLFRDTLETKARKTLKQALEILKQDTRYNNV